MTPETYGQSVAIEQILLHLTHYVLKQQEDPVAFVAQMKQGMVDDRRLEHPEIQKAAMNFFDLAVGPALTTLGHPYEHQLKDGGN